MTPSDTTLLGFLAECTVEQRIAIFACKSYFSMYDEVPAFAALRQAIRTVRERRKR